MIDHITLHVNDIEKSKAFYMTALKPFGYELIHEFDDWKLAGFGTKAKAMLWVHGTGATHKAHIALMAKDANAVRAFHKAALKAGATDNGAPGIRKNYSAGYYAAFILDPDGHNIEAVFHDKTKMLKAKPKAKPKVKAKPMAKGKAKKK